VVLSLDRLIGYNRRAVDVLSPDKYFPFLEFTPNKTNELFYVAPKLADRFISPDFRSQALRAGVHQPLDAPASHQQGAAIVFSILALSHSRLRRDLQNVPTAAAEI
jgi:hypothetical protein